MTERGILFSAPMVRALLAGTKTQTRRAVKRQPEAWQSLQPMWGTSPAPNPVAFGRPGVVRPVAPDWPDSAEDDIMCPYGVAGDRLWVRETWGVVSNAWDEDGSLIDWIPDRPATAITEMPFGQGYYTGHAIYAADGDYEWAGDDDGGGEPRTAWHPSIHMPRVASRILLEIVSVRVERLQDISDRDAIAEGIGLNASAAGVPMTTPAGETMPRATYRELWESINGAGSWDANPWVWVVEFRRIDG